MTKKKTTKAALTIRQRMDKIKELEDLSTLDTPYVVKQCFPGMFISHWGICLNGNADCDTVPVEDAIKALKWVLGQLET